LDMTLYFQYLGPEDLFHGPAFSKLVNQLIKLANFEH